MAGPDRDEFHYLIIANTEERRVQRLPPVMKVVQAKSPLYPGLQLTKQGDPEWNLRVFDRLSSGGPEFFRHQSVQIVAANVDQVTFDKLVALGWKHEPDWSALAARDKAA